MESAVEPETSYKASIAFWMTVSLMYSASNFWGLSHLCSERESPYNVALSPKIAPRPVISFW